MTNWNDPFGRVIGPPAELDREGRVRLLTEFATSLLRNEMPPAPARLFVCGAIRAFLQDGTPGSLESDYLKLHCRGSHRTLRVIASEHLIDDERQVIDSPID